MIAILAAAALQVGAPPADVGSAGAVGGRDRHRAHLLRSAEANKNRSHDSDFVDADVSVIYSSPRVHAYRVGETDTA